MDETQIMQWTKELVGWEANPKTIGKTFAFKDFYQTMSFVNAVAWLSNQEDHHPELKIGYNTCQIEYTTHAIHGLSKNDFICAAKIDALLNC
jgi:4a-hydroxytetrahydrobiopterin dehydratase